MENIFVRISAGGNAYANGSSWTSMRLEWMSDFQNGFGGTGLSPKCKVVLQAGWGGSKQTAAGGIPLQKPGGFPGNHHTSVRLAGKRLGILIRLHCLPPTTILVARQPPRAARIPGGAGYGGIPRRRSNYPGNLCFLRVFPSSWRPETRETDVTARPTDFSVYQVGSSGHFCISLGTQVRPVALAGASIAKRTT